jgi:ribonuclease Z
LQITFLGTSAGVPTRSRNVSCVALRLEQRGEVWLFDCGEGTQHQLLRCSDLRISQITRVFITHMHGDHIFGLMGLLATCGMAGHARRIDIYGPRGLGEYVREVTRRSQTRFSYPAEVHTVEPGAVFEDEEYVVTCGALAHRLPALGYRVTEKDRAGRFDVERARALGIPEGPLYGRLKRAQQITLADGRTIDGRELTGPTEKGRTVAYCTDTTYCRGSVELARGADLLIHEATFARADAELARQSTHSTAEEAARVAREAGVGRLAITHLSPRYAEVNPITPQDLLAEARAVFPNTLLARDFLTVEVPRRRQPPEDFHE